MAATDSTAHVGERFRGMAKILRAWPGQRRVPYLARERVEALRDARVRGTVAFAAEHVPHYRDLFGREEIDPRELRTAFDLGRLPFVTKHLLQEEPARFRPDRAVLPDSLPFRTTGSTGMPLTVYHDRGSLLANVAYGERERAVVAHLCGKRLRYLTLNITHSRTTGRAVRGFYGGAAFRPLRPPHVDIDVAADQDAIVAEINRLRPDVVLSDGSFLDALIRGVVARGTELRAPKVFVYRGDLMTPGGQDFVEQHTGAAVISRYNAVEAFKIGFTCEARQSFHLHEDLCHVRIVAPDGSDAGPGEHGEIVISNLVNRGTVLLNYRIGDTGRLSPGRCGCGRTSTLLAGLEGRVSEIVRLPTGKLVHPLSVWSTLKPHEHVTRYQLVQREPARFELNVVVADGAPFPQVAEAVGRDLRALLGGSAVDVVRRDRLESGPRGKFQPVVALGEER